MVEVLPGPALFSIAMIDYRDNDLGDYNEVSLAFFVRRKGETPALGVPFLGSVGTSSATRSRPGSGSCP